MTEVEHLLVCLAEECAEVQKDISKALRFGLDDINPATGITNANAIELELTDILAVVSMLVDRKVLNEDNIFNDANGMEKVSKVECFMKYATIRGTMEQTDKKAKQ